MNCRHLHVIASLAAVAILLIWVQPAQAMQEDLEVEITVVDLELEDEDNPGWTAEILLVSRSMTIYCFLTDTRVFEEIGVRIAPEDGVSIAGVDEFDHRRVDDTTRVDAGRMDTFTERSVKVHLVADGDRRVSGELGTVEVRYRDSIGGRDVAESFKLSHQPEK